MTIVASICDQGATNRTAIETLVAEAQQYYTRIGKSPKRRIICDEQEIVPLFDVPHLIKGIRNNLLSKNIVWEYDGQPITATWKDIVTAYKIDCSYGDFHSIPKINEFHIIPGKIRKMKVCYATQVFSSSVAAAIAHMARNGDSLVY